MAAIKLYYFDYRGLGEVVRLLLTLVGQDFEDIRWPAEEWSKFKHESPFGEVPFLEYNGKKIVERVAIVNFLAREFGVYGQSNSEMSRVDEVVSLTHRLIMTCIRNYYEQNEDRKAETEKQMGKETYPKYFATVDSLLSENEPNGVFVGSDLTLADVTVYDMMDALRIRNVYDAGSAFPRLQALRQRIETLPNIKTYLANRKVTIF